MKKLFINSISIVVLLGFSMSIWSANSEFIDIKRLFEAEKYLQIIKKLKDREIEDPHTYIFLARSYARLSEIQRGKTKKESMLKAFDSYQKAANRGVYSGGYQVANFYLNGWVVEQDKIKAKALWKQYEPLIPNIATHDTYSKLLAAYYYGITLGDRERGMEIYNNVAPFVDKKEIDRMFID